MPKISIITTSYKHKDFIAQTIESILSQTYTDWELLIGDDSPDNETWNIIKKYVAQYPKKIKAWHHSPNKGIVDNMNFLIERISKTSDYVAFLEGDDIYKPTNLEEKLKIFEKYGEVGLVYNNLDLIDKKGKVFLKNFLSRAPFYLKNEKLSKKQFIENEIFYSSYSTLMIKKLILQEEKIINLTGEKNFGASDWDLFFRISTKYNCYGIKKSLTLYRRHIGNISGNIINLMVDFEKQLKFYFENGIIEKKPFLYKLSYIKLLRSIAYLEQGNKKESVAEFYSSIKNIPFSNIRYKTGIFLFLLSPNFLAKKVLKLIIRRGN